MKVDGSITVSLDITNSGEMDGNEIVQLYIRDKVSSVTRPVMELKDFARILLKSGETKTVNFTIDKTKLMFWDINMQYVLEPGEFDIMVGSSSVDVKTVTFSVE
jgi:beta-glucosidase